MKFKHFLTLLSFMILAVTPLYAQDEEAAPEEEAAAEEAPADTGDAAEVPAGGGGGSSDFMFDFGVLSTISLSETDDTKAADGFLFFPQLGVRWNLGGFMIEGEFLLQTFELESDGDGDVAQGDLTFTGQSYSVLLIFGEGLFFYGGYGINQFDIDPSLDAEVNENLSATNQSLKQDVEAQSGTQLIGGVGIEIIEDLVVRGDFRILMIPAEVQNSLTDTDTNTTSESTKDVDFNFTILSVGATYLF